MNFLWLSLASLLTATYTEAEKFFEMLDGPHKPFKYWQERCVKLGGRLASINNEREQTEAQAALRGSDKGGAITGMKRIGSHRRFINGDGVPLPYTNWYPGQPNDEAPGAECLMINTYARSQKDRFGLWWDDFCKYDAALCEFDSKALKSYKKEKSSSPQTTVEWDKICISRGGRLGSVHTTAEKKLAEIALRGRDACCSDVGDMYKKKFIVCDKKVALCEFAPKTYSLVQDVGRTQTFEKWQAKCRARGLQLARIDSAEEQRRAERIIKMSPIKSSVLIDSRRENKDSEFFQNSDGKKNVYENWKSGEPNNGNMECTHVLGRSAGKFAGRWEDIGCDHVKSALCESTKFDQHTGIRYFILKEDKFLNFGAWERKCEAKGGKLAAIHNEKEQHWAEQALLTTNRDYVLTGMKRKAPHSKTFADLDGRVINYQNWYPGQPDNAPSRGGEECIELQTRGTRFGKWNDITCRLNTALCERR